MFRRMRWTHHVRHEALRRLGTTGDRIRVLDPVLDVVNIVSFVVLAIVVIATGT